MSSLTILLIWLKSWGHSLSAKCCCLHRQISRNGALWNALPHNGPPRVNPGRIQGCSNRPLSPPNQTNKSTLLRVRQTNGSFQEHLRQTRN
jgi:hypothetical protein